MSRLTLPQIYLMNLARRTPFTGTSRIHTSREQAYAELKVLTGQDFGYDVAKWRAWLKIHPLEMPIAQHWHLLERVRYLIAQCRQEHGDVLTFDQIDEALSHLTEEDFSNKAQWEIWRATNGRLPADPSLS